MKSKLLTVRAVRGPGRSGRLILRTINPYLRLLSVSIHWVRALRGRRRRSHSQQLIKMSLSHLQSRVNCTISFCWGRGVGVTLKPFPCVFELNVCCSQLFWREEDLVQHFCVFHSALTFLSVFLIYLFFILCFVCVFSFRRSNCGVSAVTPCDRLCVGLVTFLWWGQSMLRSLKK